MNLTSNSASRDEKKWFIFVQERNVGPLSAQELETRLRSAQISATTYAWADGMPDWLPLNEITELKTLTDIELDQESPPTPAPKVKASVERTRGGIDLASIPTVEINDAHLRSGKSPPPARPTSPLGRLAARLTPGRSTKRWLRRGVVCAALAGAGGAAFHAARLGAFDSILKTPEARKLIEQTRTVAAPYIAKLVSARPELIRFVPSLPYVRDVDAEALRELQLATLPIGDNRINLAVVPSKNGANPAIYVSTSLPDGAQFDVRVVGLPETLVGALESSESYMGRTEQHIVRLEMKTPAGNALPAGSYQVYVEDASTQPSPNVKEILDRLPSQDIHEPAQSRANAKLMLVKTVFVGQKDAGYERALQDFHARIREQASKELAEIRGASQAMEQQLSAATWRKRGRGARRVSNESPVPAEDLAALIGRWSTQDFLQQAYYGGLYQFAAQTGQAVLRYHEMTSQIARRTADSRSLEIRLGEALSVAQTAMVNLKAKIDFAERVAGSGELPQREGI